MKKIYDNRSACTVMTVVSFLFGMVYFFTNHFDFCIQAIETEHLSVPNILYILIHFTDVIFLPLAFIIPMRTEFGRIKTAKVLLIALGILHILTLSWSVYYIADNSFSGLFSGAAISEYQSDSAIVYNIVTWDTYSWAGSIFALIYGGLCIAAGIMLDDNIKIARIPVALLPAAYIILPLFNNIIFERRIFSVFWLANNYTVLLSMLFFTASIVFASFRENVWLEYVWDAPPIDTEEFED